MRVTLVGPWRKVRSSPVFSMPVWRYPMMGLVRSTVSPSISSMRRSTPWVLGCCGPMFMIMVWSSPASDSPSSAAAASLRRRTEPSSRRRSVADSRARSAISWAPSEVSATSWSLGVVEALIGRRVLP